MIFMGIKEVNPLVKNLFQTGLKAFFPFRRGGQDAKGYRKQSFAPLRLCAIISFFFFRRGG